MLNAMTTRNVLLALAAVTMLATGCAGQGKSAEPEKTNSGADEHHLFLEGTVSRDGEPVEGAQVEIVLWPEGGDLEVGDTIDLFDAASARSGDDGSFIVYLDPADVPSKYFSRERSLLNFQLNIDDHSEFASWGSTLFQVGSPTFWRSESEAVGADEIMRMDFDLGTERVTVTDSYGETTAGDLSVGMSHHTG